MPCSGEGNHRSGVALAMLHRHQWFSTQEREMSMKRMKFTMLNQRTQASARLTVLMFVLHGQCDARPTITFPGATHRHSLAGTKLYCLVTEAHVHKEGTKDIQCKKNHALCESQRSSLRRGVGDQTLIVQEQTGYIKIERELSLLLVHSGLMAFVAVCFLVVNAFLFSEFCLTLFVCNPIPHDTKCLFLHSL